MTQMFHKMFFFILLIAYHVFPHNRGWDEKLFFFNWVPDFFLKKIFLKVVSVHNYNFCYYTLNLKKYLFQKYFNNVYSLSFYKWLFSVINSCVIKEKSILLYPFLSFTNSIFICNKYFYVFLLLNVKFRQCFDFFPPPK